MIAAPLLLFASISLASCPSIFSLPDASAPIEERVRCIEERQQQIEEELRHGDPNSPFRPIITRGAGVYVPAHVVDGVLVPGKIVPATPDNK